MRIAITLGDPNGIGPEIAIKAAAHFANRDKIRPTLVGDGFVVEDTARPLGVAMPEFIDAPGLDRTGYAPGTLDPRAGKVTVAYYLAMFHDQGHIPIKLLSSLRASALVLGVPMLFSSVAHGCAFDIAGKGVADPTGVIGTVELLQGAS
jgi:4-hydroxy-L-threonine phosphate dehydrogenase PdxA